MDLPDLESITVKKELVNEESSGELPLADIDIELPDVKKECLEYSMIVDQISGSVTIETGPRTGEEGGCELSHTDITTDLTDVVKGCLEYPIRVEKAAAATYPREYHGGLDCNSSRYHTQNELVRSSSKSFKMATDHEIMDQSNIVDFLLNVPFLKRSVTEQLKVIADGRPTPDLKIIQNKNSSCNRKFNLNTYTKFWWMTGSIKVNRMFCWPCLLFSTTKNVWTSAGFKDLNNLMSAAMKHEQSQTHYQAALDISNFGPDRTENSLSTQTRNEITRHNEMVERNRCVLHRLIHITCFLAKQELPFLGQHESNDSVDRGIFLECVNLVSQYDGILGSHLQTENGSYSSALTDRIQNGIVNAISCLIINKIKCEINNSDFIALIVEETPDVSGSEQLCFILRYFTGTTITDRFLGFIDLGVGRKAETISGIIVNKLKDYNCTSKLIAQAYDGATSSYKNDVQSNVKLRCPHAMLVWCSPYVLNLVLARSCERIPETRNFFHIVKSISNFFQLSTKRTEFYNLLRDRRTPSDTAPLWDYNSRTINVISSERLILIEFLENIIDLPEGWDGETISSSKLFLFSLRDFEFIFLMEIFEKVFKRTDKLFQILQSGKIDFKSCTKEIKQFKCFINDLSFDSIYKNAIALTKEPETKTSIIDVKKHFERIFQDIKGNVLKEIIERYGSIGELIFLELLEYEFFRKYSEEFPSEQFLKLKSLFPFFFDFDRLRNELIYVYSSSQFARKQPLEILEYCAKKKLDNAFPQLIKLASLIVTIPASSASAEGSFSALKRIHKYLLKTKNQKRITDLSIIVIEKELLTSLKSSGTFYDDVLREFLKKESRVELEYIT